ncbi:hypothetical protein TSUD_210600 [Trifolium subterraneum]|uniref:Reverse transcriptase zinc-binding domain-containing protein n=1 Tax=Trifolium subterraneum TaxID=3900 RepID=A0A2Z6MNC8_TRISU|nr:hypothetical protein TSUD_210600 [Trifolium subterraneum]
MSDGGLWVRDLRVVNLALLGKWRRRLISGGVGLWRDIILARYGSLFPSPHLGGTLKDLKRVSCWWRNVSLLGDPEDDISDWFSEGVSKKVGNGHMTSFWFEPWLGGTSLRTQFQRLFLVSTQSTSTVREMGRWVEGQWLWDLRWIRDLFVWELNLLEIKSAFLALSRSTIDEVIFSVEEQMLLPKVLKTWAPSKVAVFSWQLLQDRA